MSSHHKRQLSVFKLSQLILIKAAGFTLIELLVVIVIVGVLSAVAVPTILQQVRRSRTAEAQQALTLIKTASEIYRSDFGIYPADYTTIAVDGAYPAKYMDQVFTNAAPNYLEPTQMSVNYDQPDLEDQGVIWRTQADPNARAYRNRSSLPIDCRIGLGVDVDMVLAQEFYVGRSCNVHR
jgi:type II secretion system protein G